MDRGLMFLGMLWTLLAVAMQTTPFAQTAQPPRDAAAPVAAAGVLRGRVVAAQGGQPLHRVRLTLEGAAAQNPPTAVTDLRGEFEFLAVPPGTYRLSAARAGYLTLQYGQRRPRELGRPIRIEAGRTVEGVQVAMYRGGVLSGRVADEQGDAAPGVRVEALEPRYLNGRQVPVPAGFATTNDRGEFRIAGLAPGSYQLRASSTDAWESDDHKTTFVHAVTYYPGVTVNDAPVRIEVDLGQLVADLALRLIPGRAARITGVVEDAAGMPLGSQQVHFDRIMRTLGGTLLGAGAGGSTQTDAQGRFVFEGLTPGEINVYAGGPSNTVASRVFLSEGDTRHVVLTPRRRPSVSGIVVVEGDTRPSFAPGRLRVVPYDTAADDPLQAWSAPSEVTVTATWTFQLRNTEGSFLFRVRNLPDEWMVRSVRLGDRDVTDVPLTIPPGAADLEGVQIVIGDGGAKISGTVADAEGRPLPDVTVIVFSDHNAHWGVGSRFVKAVRPDSGARFRAAGLPAGTYRVAARDNVIDGQWEDPAFLQSLLRGALRVDAAAGEETDVKVVVEGRR
jgi:hypothetical protein